MNHGLDSRHGSVDRGPVRQVALMSEGIVRNGRPVKGSD